MDITVEKKDNCTALLRAVAAADVVDKERKAIAASYAGQAKIPGFRPGKAPVSVVAKRFAREITEELTSRLFNQATEEALASDKDLKVLDFGTPSTCGIQEDGSFLAETTMTFVPAFELPGYKGLKVEAVSAEVTDKDVEEALEDLRNRYSDYEPVDRAVAAGDVAVVDFTSSCEGKPVSEVIGKPAGFLEGREGQWIRVEEDSFLPGFAMQLVGAKADDKKQITVTIPETFPLSELRGREVVLDVYVKEARELKLPELDDAFAARILPDGDLALLTERMKEILSASKQEEAENAKIDQIAAQLSAAVDFALPEALVERATQDLLRNRLQSAFQSLQNSGDIEKEIERMKEECREQAAKNLKVHFILQEVARKEDLKVSDQELGQEIYRIAEQQKKQPKAVLKELRSNGQLNGIAQGLLSNKAVSFILDSAIVEEAAGDKPAEEKSAKKASAKKDVANEDAAETAEKPAKKPRKPKAE